MTSLVQAYARLASSVPLTLGFRLCAIWRELLQSFPPSALKTDFAVNSAPGGNHDGRSIEETFRENKIQWYCPRTRPVKGIIPNVLALALPSLFSFLCKVCSHTLRIKI